jgi:hypothetical protein
MTQNEYQIMRALPTELWKQVMAELDEDQRKDYWFYQLLEDDLEYAMR